MFGAVLTGWGKCLPSSRLSNHDLGQFLDTSDEWIYSRTGIKERRISAFPVSDMAAGAAKNALACAGLEAEQLDLIILCTTTPDTLVPSAASKTLLKLGASHVPCMDVNAACGGFVYGLHLVKALISSGMHKRIMVVGAERLSWFQNWAQRSTSILFGDGAGALIFESSEDQEGLLSSTVGADPMGNDAIKVTDYGAGYNRYIKTSPRLNFLFSGKEVFKHAVGKMVTSSRQCLDELNIQAEDIDMFVGHQANSRILDMVGVQLKVEQDKIYKNLANYGNTSAASIPIAVCEAIQQKHVATEQLMLMAAFGAGFSYGAALLRLPKRIEAINTPVNEELEQSQTAMQILQRAIESDNEVCGQVVAGDPLYLAS